LYDAGFNKVGEEGVKRASSVGEGTVVVGSNLKIVD